RAAPGRRPGVYLRQVRHVPTRELAPLGASDGVVTLPRHLDLHAGARTLGRSDHGRAHPQPDAGARPRAPPAYRGGPGSRSEAARGHGKAREGVPRGPRGHRADGGAKPQGHGAHGSLSRAARAPTLSFVSGAEQRARLGGVPPSARSHPAPIARNLWVTTGAPRHREPTRANIQVAFVISWEGSIGGALEALWPGRLHELSRKHS